MKQFAAIAVSIVIVLGFVVVASFALLHGTQDNPTANILAGGLTTLAAQVANYWLGSSQGSSEKTDVIASLAHKALDKTPPRTGDVISEQIKTIDPAADDREREYQLNKPMPRQ